jgi:hypothetical protein
LTLGEGGHRGHSDAEAGDRRNCHDMARAGVRRGSHPSGSHAAQDAPETGYGTGPFGPWGVDSSRRL